MSCCVFGFLNFVLFVGVMFVILTVFGYYSFFEGFSGYVRKIRISCRRVWIFSGLMDMLNELCWFLTVYIWFCSAVWRIMIVSLLAMMVFRMEMSIMGNTKDMKVLICGETGKVGY